MFLSHLDFSMNLLYENSDLDADSMCSKFVEVYKSVVDHHAPLKMIPTKKKSLERKPWVTRSILKSIRKKNSLFKKFIKKKSNFTFSQYKKIRNKITREVEQEKKKYYNKLFQMTKTNPKFLWKSINKTINYKPPRSQTIKEMERSNGEATSSNSDISNIFNDYFASIGETLSKKIEILDENLLKNIKDLIRPNRSSIFLSPITPEEIDRIIQQFDNNKSSPSNSPSFWFVKISAPHISNILAHIFNKCIEEGIFPTAFKTAELHPIYKAGNKKQPGNYRPISILSPFSKIFERCIHTRLENFLEGNNLFYKCQFGFRKKSSTENAIMQICNHLTESMESNKITCSIFLDLRKAFDTVNHRILLEKLYKYGIRGSTHKLLKSFLSNRHHYTIINGVKSKEKLIKCGVPQGSTLGPLLFLIYINDFNLVTNFNLNLFADDSYLSLTHSSVEILERQVNQELLKVNQWLVGNKLSLNVEKSSYLIFSKSKTNHDFTIKLGQSTLTEQTEATYLGVILDNQLSWDSHIAKVKTKIAKTSWALTKVAKYVDIETMKKIYFGLVYPHLHYSVACWGGSAKVKPVFILQKRAIRAIGKASWRASSSPLFKELNILKFDDIYINSN